ncbi:MAG TPA: hypothetical protein VKD67_14120 [Acidimicrobiales bacterium]|nr:hypothetical protein [Acidimicrobiales bacterium]
MELVTAVGVVALAAVLVRALHLPVRFREARINAELASIVNGGTAELVEEKLRSGPQLVRVRTGRHIGGPFLDIVLDSRCLHLRLYHDARPPAPAGQSFARLTGLRRVDEIGWVAVFDGPQGPQRYLGWLLEAAA